MIFNIETLFVIAVAAVSAYMVWTLDINKPSMLFIPVLLWLLVVVYMAGSY